MRDLGTLGGTSSRAVDINEKGQVVGTSKNASGQERAFIWEQDTGMVDIGTLGGEASRATSINNSGQVVGESAKTGSSSGFLWELDTGMTDLNLQGRTPGGWKINDAGQIVGGDFSPKWFIFKERHYVFLRDPNRGGIELNLGSENVGLIKALDINNKGQVLVTYEVSPQKSHIVILTPKTKSEPARR
jgi:probable HAF family extracellular repeat protein